MLIDCEYIDFDTDKITNKVNNLFILKKLLIYCVIN